MYSYVFTGSLIIRSVFDTAPDAGRFVQGIPTTARSIPAPAPAPGEPRTIHPCPRLLPAGWCHRTGLGTAPFALPTLFVGDAPGAMPVPALQLPRQSHCPRIFALWDAHEAHKPLSCPSCTFLAGSKGGWKAAQSQFPPFFISSAVPEESHMPEGNPARGCLLG